MADRHKRSRAALLAAALIVGAGGPAPVELPPVSAPPNHEHHAGKVILVELVTPDLAAAEAFYGGLFGWTFREMRGGGRTYAEASLDHARPVAGMIERPIPAGARRQPAWLTFFATPDLDAAEATALQHGAKALFGPRDIPGRGREVVLADPQGAVFALLASNSGDPPDELASPGEWIWTSLIARDPDTGAAFYQALLGYDVYDLPSQTGREHLLLASEEYARASVNPLPANRPGTPPHWLNYVRVDDAVAAAAKVVALGGKVLVEPRIDRHGGKIAVATDPAGAPFGLMEWTETDTKDAPR